MKTTVQFDPAEGRSPHRCTAFEGTRRIASGDLATVALRTRKALDRGQRGPVLIFDDATSEQIELDLRGSLTDVSKRIKALAAAPEEPAPETAAPRGPGRPKLGVVAREVTLLPRHWQWLGQQPGGASVALRKLVEEARRANAGKDRVRKAQDSAYRFMSAMAGNLPGFEEAIRALFGANRANFAEQTGQWPRDVRDHARRLADVVFTASDTTLA